MPERTCEWEEAVDPTPVVVRPERGQIPRTACSCGQLAFCAGIVPRFVPAMTACGANSAPQAEARDGGCKDAVTPRAFRPGVCRAVGSAPGGEADPDLGAPVVILCLLYINSSSSKAALPLWISLIFPMLTMPCGAAKGVGGRRLPVFAEMNNLGVCFLSVDKCLLMPALPPALSTDGSGASGQSAIGVRTNKRARVGCQKCSA